MHLVSLKQIPPFLLWQEPATSPSTFTPRKDRSHDTTTHRHRRFYRPQHANWRPGLRSGTCHLLHLLTTGSPSWRGGRRERARVHGSPPPLLLPDRNRHWPALQRGADGHHVLLVHLYPVRCAKPPLRGERTVWWPRYSHGHTSRLCVGRPRLCRRFAGSLPGGLPDSHQRLEKAPARIAGAGAATLRHRARSLAERGRVLLYWRWFRAGRGGRPWLRLCVSHSLVCLHPLRRSDVRTLNVHPLRRGRALSLRLPYLVENAQGPQGVDAGGSGEGPHHAGPDT